MMAGSMWGALGEDTGEEGGGCLWHSLWATMRPLSFIWRLGTALSKASPGIVRTRHPERKVKLLMLPSLFVCLFLFNSSLFPHMNMLVFPLRKNTIGFNFGLDSSKKLVC